MYIIHNKGNLCYFLQTIGEKDKFGALKAV